MYVCNFSIYAYWHSFIHTYIHTYIHTHFDCSELTLSCVRVRVYVCTFFWTGMFLCMYAHAHTYIRKQCCFRHVQTAQGKLHIFDKGSLACIHTYIHTYIRKQFCFRHAQGAASIAEQGRHGGQNSDIHIHTYIHTYMRKQCCFRHAQGAASRAG